MKYQGVVSEAPRFFNDRHQVTFATEVCLVEPNTSDKFKCAVENRRRILRRATQAGRARVPQLYTLSV